jgi:hypothetical protein
MKKKDSLFSFKRSNIETIKKIEDDLAKIDDELSYMDAEEKVVKSCLIDFSYQINRLYSNVFSDYSSQIITDCRISAGEFNPVTAEVKKNGNEIKIHYNCLPAKRNAKISDSNKISTEFFRMALDNAIKESGIKHRYDSKCVIIYYIYYNERKPTDLDNYDFKNITDSICAHFLIDDSPKYISQFFKGEPSDGESYLDITIIPVDQFYLYV